MPNTYADNPYLDALRASLQGLGVSFADTSSPGALGIRWLWAQRRDTQVIHLHVVQPFYAYQGTQARLRWVLRFARNLVAARMFGYRTVFTLHDLKPFDQLRPAWVDYLGHWVAANLTDSVIVHYESGRRALARRFGRRWGVCVVGHPNYIGLYPNEVTRERARTLFGFDANNFVFAFVGGIRPSKGIERLIDAFRHLSGEQYRLLIAGRAWHPMSYTRELLEQASRDQRVQMTAEFVPAHMLQYFLNAADVVVLPFREVLTSGSAVLASSFGLPVIAPAKGCLVDEIASDSGILYNPDNPEGLYKALVASTAADLPAMGRRGLERVSRWTWDDMAQRTLAAYRGRRAQV